MAAYILDSTTISNPTAFSRRTVEVSGVHTTLNGRTVKDVRNRKDQFILDFPNLLRTCSETDL